MNDKTIVLGISGSIAVYKSLKIIKQLKQQGAAVHVIMTEHATHLAHPKEFEETSSNPVHTHLFHPDVDFQDYIKRNEPIKHISLADVADLFLVCPATANILAKVAHGIADDLLSTSILATAAPVVFCPAMNVKMWKNQVTQDNVKRLKQLGYYFVDPEYGDLACGYQGVGRLASPAPIIDVVTATLSARNQLKGKKVLVTAGATAEPIDAVRTITNKASGKMGAALADSASLMGAEVVLIKGVNAIEPKRFMKEISVETGEQMKQAVEKEIKNSDMVFHTAAVSDFSLDKPIEGKIDSSQPLHLEFSPRLKILKSLKKRNPKAFIVGFKAEYNVTEEELIDSAYKTLQESNADLIVANDVGKKGRGFGVDTNEVYIVYPSYAGLQPEGLSKQLRWVDTETNRSFFSIDKAKRVKHLPLATKVEIARQILDFIIHDS